jgi:hypothetical protein
MHPVNGIDGLDLNDQFIGDDDIRPKASLQQPVAIDDRNRKLPLEANPGIGQFKGKAFPINRLEKPRPESPMHINRQPDHLLGQRPMHQHRRLSGPLWVLRASPCEPLTLKTPYTMPGPPGAAPMPKNAPIPRPPSLAPIASA